MIRKHYDVVVLGRSPPALVAAALLARRDFTVLVVGQGDRGPAYRLGALGFRRRAFTMLAATSPVWKRVISELAQSPTWKRRVRQAEPMLQVLAAQTRLDLHPELSLFTREIERELPEVRRSVDELYAELARVNALADEAFDIDATWPPGTFWERRETDRAANALPYVRAEADADLLVDFPKGHLFRNVVVQTALFATDLSQVPPPFAIARLHGAWTRGLSMLSGGEQELEDFLIERIESHGGKCCLSDKAVSITVRRGALEGIVLDGDEDTTGATFLLADLDGEAVAALAGGEGVHKRAQREWPRVTSTVGRYVLSAVVRQEGLPSALGPEALILPGRARSERARALRAPLHLQRVSAGSGRALLIAEVLLPDRASIAMLELRERILEALTQELPFLERHLVAVDSVHDGLPVWVYEGGERTRVERSELTGAALTPEPMVRKLEVDPPGYLGIAGEPLRGPLEHTFLIGRSVLPALGQEGQLLAAVSAARVITRSDRQKERMRREMWNKIELG